MNEDIKMSLELARGVCQAEQSCCSEGLAGNESRLMAWISETYPQLKEEFSWMSWENWEETK